MDLDIISHELPRAEFYNRIGFYKYTFRIPKWFGEGLAMQNDYRNYYSEDTLKRRTHNFKNLPDVKKLITGNQFNEGGTKKIMLNFMASKYEVKIWYTKEKLSRLIGHINSGNIFEKTFEN